MTEQEFTDLVKKVNEHEAVFKEDPKARAEFLKLIGR